jgi:hypothetical protein
MHFNKNHIPHKILIVIGILLFAAGGAFGFWVAQFDDLLIAPSPAEQYEVQKTSTSTISSNSNNSANTFEYSTIKTGQNLNGFKVVKVMSNLNQPISAQNILVEFTSNVTLSGTLTENEGMGSQFTINNLTQESQNRLPRLINDDRTVWFGISNPTVVKNSGMKNGERVKVTLKKYLYIFYPAGVWNEAELSKIEKIQ